MAGMRFVVGVVLLTCALALLAPAGARAGTYDVVSCNAPGAGGVNHSLAGSKGLTMINNEVIADSSPAALAVAERSPALRAGPR